MASAPFVQGSFTSELAAEQIEPHMAQQETTVFDVIRRPAGATDDEIKVETGLPHQSVSVRRRGLVLRGLVLAAAGLRKTRSGRWAQVWERVS